MKKQLIASLTIILALFIPLESSRGNSMLSHNESLNKVEVKTTPELTLENFIKVVEDNDIICPDIVISQAKLESNNFKSFLLKRTNNMFGMKYPLSRKTTAIGLYIPKKDTIIYGTQKELKKHSKENNYNTYAVFENWVEAVKDHKLWQKRSFKLEAKYYDLLSRVYAEDTLYVTKLKKINKG